MSRGMCYLGVIDSNVPLTLTVNALLDVGNDGCSEKDGPFKLLRGEGYGRDGQDCKSNGDPGRLPDLRRG